MLHANFILVFLVLVGVGLVGERLGLIDDALLDGARVASVSLSFCELKSRLGFGRAKNQLMNVIDLKLMSCQHLQWKHFLVLLV